MHITENQEEHETGSVVIKSNKQIIEEKLNQLTPPNTSTNNNNNNNANVNDIPPVIITPSIKDNNKPNVVPEASSGGSSITVSGVIDMSLPNPHVQFQVVERLGKGYLLS